MRRIDPDEPGSSSGRIVSPPLQAQAATVEAGALSPARAPFADIVIRRMTFLGGPGIWTYRPVVEAVVDIGALEDHPSNTLPGFYDRLTAWLPGLIEHRCSVGGAAAF
jgi:cyanophycin synthetase